MMRKAIAESARSAMSSCVLPGGQPSAGAAGPATEITSTAHLRKLIPVTSANRPGVLRGVGSAEAQEKAPASAWAPIAWSSGAIAP